ncbi:MAG: hypothetical protein IV100_15435 [Myxococcales bacterium]|nr:hypothetical protein [Myxococcales bacterium]
MSRGPHWPPGQVVLDTAAMPAPVPPVEGSSTGVIEGSPRAGVWASGLQRAAVEIIVVPCHSLLQWGNDAARIMGSDRATVVVELDLGSERRASQPGQ